MGKPFVALYTGNTPSDTVLVAVSDETNLVRDVAGRVLQALPDLPPTDPVAREIEAGKRKALELIVHRVEAG